MMQQADVGCMQGCVQLPLIQPAPPHGCSHCVSPLILQEGGELPSTGQAVRPGELHALIQRLAAALDLPPQQDKSEPAPVANGSSGQNGVHAEASSSAEGSSEDEQSSS